MVADVPGQAGGWPDSPFPVSEEWRILEIRCGRTTSIPKGLEVGGEALKTVDLGGEEPVVWASVAGQCEHPVSFSNERDWHRRRTPSRVDRVRLSSMGANVRDTALAATQTW